MQTYITRITTTKIEVRLENMPGQGEHQKERPDPHSLLFAIKSVTKKPKGVGFNFKNWYHYLCKLRFYAKELGVPVRTIERTLFLYHKDLQTGTLY
jgi:hypothetical protein